VVEVAQTGLLQGRGERYDLPAGRDAQLDPGGHDGLRVGELLFGIGQPGHLDVGAAGDDGADLLGELHRVCVQASAARALAAHLGCGGRRLGLGDAGDVGGDRPP
jgi:hypothetical protein